MIGDKRATTDGDNSQSTNVMSPALPLVTAATSECTNN